MGNLFSIGHSHHPLNEFFALLKQFDIDYLLDVRSTPYSKFAEDYNREYIANVSTQYDVKYFYMGDFFGARPKDTSLYSALGFLDFEKVRASEHFNKGLESVVRGLKENHNIALMCTEKEPIDCHRAILVARAFEIAEIDVKHILSGGEIILQSDLNRKLLDMYFPDRYQGSLFDTEEMKSDAELLEEAYRIRNQEIGFHLKEE